MAPPDAYARRRGAARPPREGRRGPRSPSRLDAGGRRLSRGVVAAADEEAARGVRGAERVVRPYFLARF